MHCVSIECPNCVSVMPLHLWDRFPCDVVGGYLFSPSDRSHNIKHQRRFIVYFGAGSRKETPRDNRDSRIVQNRAESFKIGANYVIDVFVKGPAFYDGRGVFVTTMFRHTCLTFMIDFCHDCVAPRTAVTCV
jgi:hypothetical protein